MKRNITSLSGRMGLYTTSFSPRRSIDRPRPVVLFSPFLFIYFIFYFHAVGLRGHDPVEAMTYDDTRNALSSIICYSTIGHTFARFCVS